MIFIAGMSHTAAAPWQMACCAIYGHCRASDNVSALPPVIFSL